MNSVYYLCIGIGLVILILTVIFDVFDNVLEFDFFDIDIGDFEIAILPVSMRALCLASIVFGSISLILGKYPMLLKHIIAGVFAYISAVAVQTLTRILKKHQTLASSKEILLLSDSTVSNTIVKDGFGSIITERLNDSSISTTAKSEDGSEIKQGTKVKVIEFKDNYVVVKPIEE